MAVLEDHPLAAIFPLMGETDLAALADDIRTNGLRDAVWLLDGKILDGRNRYRACQQVGKPHHTQEYTGTDPLGFVLSKNLHRRHLDAAQRAAVAANIANITHGGNRRADQAANLPLEIPPVSQAKAAEMMNVSERAVRDAVKVKADGVPELVKAVESGEVSVSAAAEVAKLPKAEQKKVVKAGKVKEAAAQKRKAKKDQAGGGGSAPATDSQPAEAAPAEPTPTADDPENPPLDPRFMPGAARAVLLAEKFRTWKAQLVALRTAVRKEFPDRDEVMARRIDARGQFDASLTELADTLDRNVPEHVCPDCCGTGAPEAGGVCKFCDGFGVVDRHHHGGLKARWKRTAPRLAALRAAAGGVA